MREVSPARHVSRHQLIADRQQGYLGKPVVQRGVGLRRLRVRVDQKQQNGFDALAPRLLKQLNFVGNDKEIAELATVDVNDFRNVLRGDQAVEQPDLTAYVADVHDLGVVRCVIVE